MKGGQRNRSERQIYMHPGRSGARDTPSKYDDDYGSSRSDRRETGDRNGRHGYHSASGSSGSGGSSTSYYHESGNSHSRGGGSSYDSQSALLATSTTETSVLVLKGLQPYFTAELVPQRITTGTGC